MRWNKCISSIIVIIVAVCAMCATSFAGSKPEVTSHTVQAMDRALSVNVQWQSENPVTSVKIFAGRTEKEITIDEYDNHRNPAGYYGEVSGVIPLDPVSPLGAVAYQIQLVDDLKQKSNLLSGQTTPQAVALPGIAPRPGMTPQQGAMMPVASQQDDGWGKSNIMAGKGQGTQPGSNTSNSMIDKMLAVADRFDLPPSLDAIRVNALGPTNVSFSSRASDAKGLRDITFRVYDGVGNKVGEQVLANLGKKWEGSTDSIAVTGSGPFRVTALASNIGGSTSKEQVATFNMGAPARVPAAVPAPAPACISAPSGLVLYWKGEGNAIDQTGLNNGTLMNGATFAQGMVGQAFSFDGSNRYVVAPDSPSLYLTSQFTLQAWVNPASVPDVDAAIISKIGGIGGNNGYQLSISKASVPGCQFNASGEPWSANNIVAGLAPFNTWTHIACTYDNDRLSMYVNGTLVGSNVIGSKNVVKTSSTLRVSGDDNNHVYFNGLIDEAQIYNRALTANEIQNIYRSGSNGVCSTVAPAPAPAPAPVPVPVAAQVQNGMVPCEIQIVSLAGDAAYTDCASVSIDGGEVKSLGCNHDRSHANVQFQCQANACNRLAFTFKVNDTGRIVANSDIRTFNKYVRFASCGDRCVTINFEDLPNGDFDYNDLIMKIQLIGGSGRMGIDNFTGMQCQ